MAPPLGGPFLSITTTTYAPSLILALQMAHTSAARWCLHRRRSISPAPIAGSSLHSHWLNTLLGICILQLYSHVVRFINPPPCGDGHQLSLAKYPTYYGVEVSKRALTICQKRFNDDSTKRFGPEAPLHGENFDLALSLDVIYYLVEDETYERYMESLFAASRSWVIIYSSNVSPAEFTKLYPNHSAPHVKHHKFTEWADTRLSGWRLVRHDRNLYPFDMCDPNDTTFADFFVYERAGVVR